MKCSIVYLSIALYIFSVTANAAHLDVPENLWLSLSSEEKLKVSSEFELQLQSPTNYGLIIDSQILNKSTSGTTGMSQLGSTYAQANYLDRAFQSSDIDYSAKKQLGVALLGAVVGSIFDRKAEAKFVTRYTVKLSSNEIKYLEEQADSQGFSHPNGLCVLLNPIRPASQELCLMTKEDLMLKVDLRHNLGEVKNKNLPLEQVPNKFQNSEQGVQRVKCKIGNNPITYVDKNLCINANGEIQ